MFRAVVKILCISRPVLWINTLGPALIGLWLTNQLWHSAMTAVLIWLSLPFNLLIYGINDIFDREVDEISKRKGGIEGVKLKTSDVGFVIKAVVLLNFPFLLYFYVAFSIQANLWIMLYIVIFIAYSVPPLRFKARPIIDSLSNSAYALPLAFVPAVLSKSINFTILFGLMAWSVAKHAYDSIQDYKEDDECDLKTITVVFGVKFALLWALFFWGLSSLLFLQINASVAVVNTIGFLALLVPVFNNQTAEKAHQYYKYSIAYPYLVGTYAGILLCSAVLLGHWQ